MSASSSKPTTTATPLPPTTKLRIRTYLQEISVVRLPPKSPIEPWMIEANPDDTDDGAASVWGCLRTRDELSVVVPTTRVPPALSSSYTTTNTTTTKHEGGWACLKVEPRDGQPLDFELVGILSSVTAPLAEAGISIFALSTYNTDYVLVKKSEIDRATAVLEEVGGLEVIEEEEKD